MASLHIKSFGPIVDSTRIELTPLMVLIGRQSDRLPVFKPDPDIPEDVSDHTEKFKNKLQDILPVNDQDDKKRSDVKEAIIQNAASCVDMENILKNSQMS